MKRLCWCSDPSTDACNQGCAANYFCCQTLQGCVPIQLETKLTSKNSKKHKNQLKKDSIESKLIFHSDTDAAAAGAAAASAAAFVFTTIFMVVATVAAAEAAAAPAAAAASVSK